MKTETAFEYIGKPVTVRDHGIGVVVVREVIGGVARVEKLQEFYLPVEKLQAIPNQPGEEAQKQ